MWTDHCEQDGDSIFPPSLITEPTDIIVQKGLNQHVDAYSAFMDNTRKLKTELDDILQENDVDTLYIVGIATDYCVYFTTIDGLTLGYKVYVVLDATRGIANETIDAAVADMESQGANIISSEDVLAMECPEATSGGTVASLWSLFLVNVCFAGCMTSV